MGYDIKNAIVETFSIWFNLFPFIKTLYFSKNNETKNEYCKPTLFKLRGLINRIIDNVRSNRFILFISNFNILFKSKRIVNIAPLKTDIEKFVKNI